MRPLWSDCNCIGGYPLQAALTLPERRQSLGHIWPFVICDHYFASTRPASTNPLSSNIH